MDISQEGLRHYERKGIIHPERDPENGYRYYSLRDTLVIAFCKKFRTFGFSPDDAVTLLHETDTAKRLSLTKRSAHRAPFYVSFRTGLRHRI